MSAGLVQLRCPRLTLLLPATVALADISAETVGRDAWVVFDERPASRTAPKILEDDSDQVDLALVVVKQTL